MSSAVLAIPAGIEVQPHFYMRDDGIMIPLDGLGALTHDEWAAVRAARDEALAAGKGLDGAAAAAFDVIAKTGKVTKVLVGRAIWKLVQELSQVPR